MSSFRIVVEGSRPKLENILIGLLWVMIFAGITYCLGYALFILLVVFFDKFEVYNQLTPEGLNLMRFALGMVSAVPAFVCICLWHIMRHLRKLQVPPEAKKK